MVNEPHQIIAKAYERLFEQGTRRKLTNLCYNEEGGGNKTNKHKDGIGHKFTNTEKRGRINEAK